MLKKKIFSFLKSKNSNVASVRDNLLNPVTDALASGGNKVTIVGCGQVGMACAICILTQHIASELCIIDGVEEKLIGEMMDLQHGSTFLRNPKITASTDYADSANSRLCIITAGVRQKQGESRLTLVQRNADVIKEIAPKLVDCSPDTILLLATNPVDIMTYVAWRTSCLPRNRVIGSGTNLDSSRFHFLIAQRLGIAPTSCHGWVIGEHGDSSVPVWSSVNVSGVRLCELNPKIGSSTDPENWNEVHKQVVDAGYVVRRKKGYTSWAIGLSVASLASTILRSTSEIAPVSTSVLGEYGITDDIFLSLPCVLNAKGVSHVVRHVLTKTETKQLHKSVKIIAEVQAGLSL